MTFEDAFAAAVKTELEGETTMLKVRLEPVFPRVVKHPLTIKCMKNLEKQGSKMMPPANTLGELLPVAFAEGVSVGVLLTQALQKANA